MEDDCLLDDICGSYCHGNVKCEVFNNIKKVDGDGDIIYNKLKLFIDEYNEKSITAARKRLTVVLDDPKIPGYTLTCKAKEIGEKYTCIYTNLKYHEPGVDPNECVKYQTNICNAVDCYAKCDNIYYDMNKNKWLVGEYSKYIEFHNVEQLPILVYEIERVLSDINNMGLCDDIELASTASLFYRHLFRTYGSVNKERLSVYTTFLRSIVVHLVKLYKSYTTDGGCRVEVILGDGFRFGELKDNKNN